MKSSILFVTFACALALFDSVSVCNANPAGPTFFADVQPASPGNVSALFPAGHLVPFSFWSPQTGNFSDMATNGITAVGPRTGSASTRTSIVASTSGTNFKIIYPVGYATENDVTTNASQSLVNAKIKADLDDLWGVNGFNGNATEWNNRILWWFLTPSELYETNSTESNYIIWATAKIRDWEHNHNLNHKPITTYVGNAYTDTKMTNFCTLGLDQGTLVVDSLYPGVDFLGKGSYANYAKFDNKRRWITWSIEQVTLTNTAIQGTTNGTNRMLPFINVVYPEMVELKSDDTDPSVGKFTYPYPLQSPEQVGQQYGTVPLCTYTMSDINNYVDHDIILSMIGKAQAFVVYRDGASAGAIGYQAALDANAQGANLNPDDSSVGNTTRVQYYNRYLKLAKALNTGALSDKLGRVLLYGTDETYATVSISPNNNMTFTPSGYEPNTTVTYPMVVFKKLACDTNRWLFVTNSHLSVDATVTVGNLPLPYTDGSGNQWKIYWVDAINGGNAIEITGGGFQFTIAHGSGKAIKIYQAHN